MPKPAGRMNKIPPYLFASLDKQKQQAIKSGIDVLDFGIGDPNFPTPKEVIKALNIAIEDVSTHNYPPYSGLTEFKTAVSDYYKKRFNVDLEAESEVLALIGSKEGLANMTFAYIEEGDYSLVPDPAYPVYKNATILAGGTPYIMPLLEKNDYLPDLSAIPSDVATKAKLMFLNYPNNPTSAIGDMKFFKHVVDFAHEFDILVCHDAAYTEITFDGYKAPSFLEIPHAKHVAVEFNSLSKPFNMTGWRIGMVVGNKDAVQTLASFKNNIDSSVFKAIQRAAISALNLPDSHLTELNKIYKQRRETLTSALTDLGFTVTPTKGTFYLWVKIPDKYKSIDFISLLLQNMGIMASPGNGYGEYGEGYIRFSLTASEKAINEFPIRMREKWDKEKQSFR